MRKFTKGLLMTFVASAISLSAYSQDIEGYFRVINLGYSQVNTGVMNVTSKSTALPDVAPADATTMAGTVMYIKATPVSQNPETQAQYIDINQNDLIVENLRSQAVDASAAVYAPVVADLRDRFQIYMKGNLTSMSDAEIEETLDKMFYYMQMFLEPTQDGYYYLKSTTPDLLPLAEAIMGEGKELSTDPDQIKSDVIKFLRDNGQDQAADEWEELFARIHMGHTYYLIGGKVTPDFKARTQTFDAGATPIISFANANKFYPDLAPEIEVAGDYSKWILEPVDAQNVFGIKATLEGLDKNFYATGYFDFPFTTDAKVYGIKSQPVLCEANQFGSVEPNKEDIIAYVTLEKYEGTIPAHTPVVIECKSSDVTVLQPTDVPADEGDATIMKGIFFAESFNETATEPNDDDEFEFYELPLGTSTKISRKVIRVLNQGKNTLNPLGFFKFKGSEITANKGFIVLDEAIANANIAIVDAQAYADGINEIATESKSNVIYDIQGRIVNNPTQGLYIVNGKKVVIK